MVRIAFPGFGGVYGFLFGLIVGVEGVAVGINEFDGVLEL